MRVRRKFIIELDEEEMDVLATLLGNLDEKTREGLGVKGQKGLMLSELFHQLTNFDDD